MGIIQRAALDSFGRNDPPNRCSTQDVAIAPKLYPVEYNSREMGIKGKQAYRQGLSPFIEVIPDFIPNYPAFPRMLMVYREQHT